MSKWCYGIIQEKGELKVAELYFNKDGGLMTYLVLNKKDLRKKKDRQMMANDILNQIKEKIIYTEGDIHKEL